MNALWITRMSRYINSPLSLESAKILIQIKINQKRIVLKKYKRSLPLFPVTQVVTIPELLLYEARAGTVYWREFKTLVPPAYNFVSRKPRNTDTVNRLLDIGYHHITNSVTAILHAHDISPHLGLIHVARTSDSKPLSYDLVEMFRADIVDSEVLRYLRLKKKPEAVNATIEIAHFLHEVNKRLDKKYYIADFGQCHTYRYYMELQILKFIRAINHNHVFSPIHLPTRHESRCT